LKKSNVNKSTNSETWLQCQHCEKKFISKTGLNIHIGKKHHPSRSSTNNSETWLPCQHCEKKFLTEAGLNIHIGRKHPSRKEPEEHCAPLENDLGNQESESENTENCGKKFLSKYDLQTHIGKRHPPSGKTPTVESDMGSTVTAMEPVKKNHAHDFLIPANKLKWSSHESSSSVAVNLTEKAAEFRCENCWSVWSDEYKLKNHIKLEHELQSCKICNIEEKENMTKEKATTPTI
jgi:hypothetical protein